MIVRNIILHEWNDTKWYYDIFTDSGAFEYTHSPGDCHDSFNPNETVVQPRGQYGSAVQSSNPYGSAVQPLDQPKTADHGKQEESASDILDTLSDSSGDNMEDDFVDDPLQELGTEIFVVQLLCNYHRIPLCQTLNPYVEGWFVMNWEHKNFDYSLQGWPSII